MKHTDFTHSIETFIRRHELLVHGGLYIVALSGGADSVALLLALTSLGYRVEAAHCNFHLRGKESDRDEAFCTRLCDDMGVCLHKAHFDTVAFAATHKVSIEMAARELRYHYFGQLCHDLGAKGVCVAHHQDDQVETVLLHLVRGTGLKGLVGMKPRNGMVIRPLLGVNRSQILDYLAGRQQGYVTDSSNLQDDVQRNKIRLDVMPLLRKINPAVADNILAMSEYVDEAAVMLDDCLRRLAREVTVSPGCYDLKKIRQYVSPAYLLWWLVGNHGFKREQVLEMLLNNESGKYWATEGYVIYADRGRLCEVTREEWERPMPQLVIPETGCYCYNDGKGSSMKFRVDMHQASGFEIDRCPSHACLDASVAQFPLTLRPVRQGDRFVPFGMKGSKLVSDFLTDQKCSVLDKRRQLVVTGADGHMLWLVGRRIDNAAAVLKGRTERVLTIVMEKNA